MVITGGVTGVSPRNQGQNLLTKFAEYPSGRSIPGIPGEQVPKWNWPSLVKWRNQQLTSGVVIQVRNWPWPLLMC